MARLRARQRKNLPASDFGLPATRQYPEEDKAHARDAKARASEEQHVGRITRSQEAQIDRKANRKLGVVAKRAKNRAHGRFH